MSVETAVVSVPETPEGQVLALVEEPGKPSEMIRCPRRSPPAAAAKPPEPSSPAGSRSACGGSPGGGRAQTSRQQGCAAEQAEPAPAPQRRRLPARRSRSRRSRSTAARSWWRVQPIQSHAVRGYANEILLGDAKASPDGRYLIEAERDLPVGDYIIRVDALEPDGVKVAARAAVPFEREPGETIAAVAPVAPEPVAPAPPRNGRPLRSAGGHCSATSAKAPTPVAALLQRDARRGRSACDSPGARGCRGAGCATAGGSSGGRGGNARGAAFDRRASRRRCIGRCVRVRPAAGCGDRHASGSPKQPAATAEAPGRRPLQISQPLPRAGTPAAEQPAAPLPTAEAPQRRRQLRDPATSPPPVVAETPAAKPRLRSHFRCACGERPPAPPAEPETDIAAAPAPESELPAPPPAGVDEVLAPKLQSAGGAVIIRRGDSLWRISRRVSWPWCALFDHLPRQPDADRGPRPDLAGTGLQGSGEIGRRKRRCRLFDAGRQPDQHARGRRAGGTSSRGWRFGRRQPGASSRHRQADRCRRPDLPAGRPQ